MPLLRLYHTARHLRWQQIFYRFCYPLKARWYREPVPPTALPSPHAPLPLRHACWRSQYQPGRHSFCFLHRELAFGNRIDWDEPRNGRLWTYHLNYWEWLEDPALDAHHALLLMKEYAAAPGLRTRQEPYPASLRIIHWTRYCLRQGVHDPALSAAIFRDAHRVLAFREYHLDGNHLLENGLALWHAAFFLGDNDLQEEAARLLKRELQEQILPDGGHYERSVMYHAQLLLRLLHCTALSVKGAMQDLFREKAALMLGWMKAYCFSDGSFACIGDAAPDETPPLPFLEEYAADLDIYPAPVTLGDSGYRKLRAGQAEVLVNAGAPSPAHQPGHAHADTFSFCLWINGVQVVTDTGISTYETGAVRLRERGTAAHNTVALNGRNSSDIWASFRMGHRARVHLQEDTPRELRAVHDGYRNQGIVHERSFRVESGELVVEDRLSREAASAHWHLHGAPGIEILQETSFRFKADATTIILEGFATCKLEPYDCAEGYNRLKTALRLSARMDGTGPFRARFIFGTKTSDL